MDKTLLKGLKIMEILARSDGPRGVTELAAQV
ncbi:helix-turn-helix domain-containing protein, partial [Acinetobacter baumannii]